jgi:hypothetical protein
MQYFYSAYGLTIDCDFPLPELLSIDAPQGQAACDITIRKTLKEIPFDKPRARLAWLGIGVFWIRFGREIRFTPYPDSAEPAVRLALLGQVLAAILHQRGYLTLHASGVALAGAGQNYALGFLGDSRQGKSTMAAAFHAAGHHAVADDIIAVSSEALAATAADENALPLIFPGFPTLKLWPEATMEIYNVPESQQPTPFSDYTPRRIRDIRNAFSQDALPLARLYILEDGAEISSERINRPLAIQQLMRHAYWTPELPAEEKAVLFRQCVTLCERVDVYRLRRPRDLTLLPAVVKFVEGEFSNTSRMSAF